LAGRLVVWAKPALTEGAHKFVAHSVQAILFAALAAISSVVIYLVDPWPKIARYLPLKEISERELISKGVPKAAPSPIETSTPQAKDPKPPPSVAEQAPVEPRTIQSWTTDVYPERE